MKLILFVLAIVGAFAHHNGPHLFQDDDSVSEDHHHHHRGKMICSLIAFQNPDVTVEECVDIAQQIRSTCQEQHADTEEQSVVWQCVRDEMKAKFSFISIRDMPVEQRSEFVTQQCSRVDENGNPMHENVEECVTPWMNAIDGCIESTEDDQSFRQCMRNFFRSMHNGGGDHHGEHHGHHGRGHHQPEGEELPHEKPNFGDERDMMQPEQDVGHVEEPPLDRPGHHAGHYRGMHREHATGDRHHRSMEKMRDMLSITDDRDVKPLNVRFADQARRKLPPRDVRFADQARRKLPPRDIRFADQARRKLPPRDD